jgi:hypothetical protein
MESSRARPSSAAEIHSPGVASSFGQETNRAPRPISEMGGSIEGVNRLRDLMSSSNTLQKDSISSTSQSVAPLHPSLAIDPDMAGTAVMPVGQVQLTRVPSFSVNDEASFTTSRAIPTMQPPVLNILPASPIDGPTAEQLGKHLSGQHHDRDDTQAAQAHGIEIRVHPEEPSTANSPNTPNTPGMHSTVETGGSQAHSMSPPPLGSPQSDLSYSRSFVDAAVDRPATAASGDTFLQAQTLFQDFDGIHYQQSLGTPSVATGADVEPSEANYSATLPRSEPPGLPPPAKGMVFYPAPVPAALNLPPRLSNIDPAQVAAQKRKMMFAALAPEARKSALQLNETPDSNASFRQHNKSTSDLGAIAASRMAALPPQLRAALFFEKPSALQDVQVRDKSAVATLDALLDASTTAPVSAFTDHPFAGSVSEDLFKPARKLKPMSSMNDLNSDAGLGKRVGSFFGLGSKSQGDASADGTARSQGSRVSSINADVGLDGETGDHPRGSNHSRAASENLSLDEKLEAAQAEEALKNAGPPTTLVAELQIRKAAQKLRNKTATQAFPNGMHATLLELDAVAQIQKHKRKKTRVTLAWEDPDVAKADIDESDDEDVPLGVLFASRSPANQIKNGPPGYEPMGLIQQRELEDNEPLAKRKARLQAGTPLSRPNSQFLPPVVSRPMTPGQNSVGSGNTGDDDDIPGETLAERLKRLKERRELDATIESVRDSNISRGFAEEMFGEINSERDDSGASRPSTAEGPPPPAVESEKIKVRIRESPRRARTPAQPIPSPSTSPKAESPESGEETLGQRKARLQAKKLEQSHRPGLHIRNVSQDIQFSTSSLHPLRTSTSMADLLQDGVAGPPSATRRTLSREVSPSVPQVSLLEANESMKAARREQISAVNGRRTPSGALLEMVGDTRDTARKSSAAFRGALSSEGFGGISTAPVDPNTGVPARSSSGFRGGIYNNGYGGVAPTGSAMSIHGVDMGMANQGAGGIYPYNGFVGSTTMLGGMAASTPNLLVNNMGMMGMSPPMMSTPMMAPMVMPLSTPMMSIPMGTPMMSMPMGMPMGMPMAAPGISPPITSNAAFPAQRTSSYMSGLHNIGHTPGRSATPSQMPGADAFLDAKGRQRINEWRQSVQVIGGEGT